MQRYKLSRKSEDVTPGSMRASVVAVVRRRYGYDKSFTEQEVVDFIKASRVNLGSGTPQSFFDAFADKQKTKVGYFEPVKN